jgi:hypothetical protein
MLVLDEDFTLLPVRRQASRRNAMYDFFHVQFLWISIFDVVNSDSNILFMIYGWSLVLDRIMSRFQGV